MMVECDFNSDCIAGNVDLASLERMTRRMAQFEASIFQKREDEANGNGRRGRGKRVSEQETSFQVDLAAAVERASLGASGRQIDEDEAVDAQFEQQLQELKASGAAAAHVGRHDDYASKYYRAKFGDGAIFILLNLLFSVT
jgi:5'-3' exonuclease